MSLLSICCDSVGFGSLGHTSGEIWRIRGFSWHIELLAWLEVKGEGFEKAGETSRGKDSKQEVDDGSHEEKKKGGVETAVKVLHEI